MEYDKDRLLEYGLDPDNFPDKGFIEAALWGVTPNALIAAFGAAFMTHRGQPVFVVDHHNRPRVVVWDDGYADALNIKPLMTGWPLCAGVAVHADTGELATLRPRDSYSTFELDLLRVPGLDLTDEAVTA